MRLLLVSDIQFTFQCGATQTNQRIIKFYEKYPTFTFQCGATQTLRFEFKYDDEDGIYIPMWCNSNESIGTHTMRKT